MANTNFNYRSQFRFSNAAKPISLFAQINIGGTGAPTIASGTGMGITSIARNSAGDYTITLTRKFAALLALEARFIASAGLPAAPVVGIKSNAVASAGTIEIVCSTGGVATDPANGEKILLEIVLNDSSLAY